MMEKQKNNMLIQHITSGLMSESSGMFRSGSKKEEPCWKARLQDTADCDSACIDKKIIYSSYMIISECLESKEKKEHSECLREREMWSPSSSLERCFLFFVPRPNRAYVLIPD